VLLVVILPAGFVVGSDDDVMTDNLPIVFYE
jgi:hypothetical protein